MAKKREKSKKREKRFFIFIGIVGFILLLLIASLVFVFVKMQSLEASLEEGKKNITVAFDKRQEVTDKLVKMLEGKMTFDKEPFENLKKANAQLKKADTVEEITNANLKVDSAIDGLVYVMRDKYLYLEGEDVLNVITEVDNARSRIVLEYTEYNTTAADYNYAVDNFPGSMFAYIFGYEKTGTYKPVDYQDLTY